MYLFMGVPFLYRLGNITPIVTILSGMILSGHYYFTRDVESGTLLYFYILLAGWINAAIFFILVAGSFVYKNVQKKLIIKSVYTILSYLAILMLTCLVF